MSASNPNKGSGKAGVVKKRYEWNGEQGYFVFWNKETGQKEIVEKLIGIVLDPDVACIGGFSDALNAGLYSNYFSDTRKDIITVRNSATKRIVAGGHGLYANIKDTLKALGAEFTKAIMLYDPQKDEIFAVHLAKSAFQEYLEFEKQNGGAHSVVLKVMLLKKNPNAKTKGRITYFVPAFSVTDSKNQEYSRKAVEKDVELQKWLIEGYTADDSDESDVPLSGAQDIMSDEQKRLLDEWDAPNDTPVSAQPVKIEEVDDLPF